MNYATVSREQRLEHADQKNAKVVRNEGGSPHCERPIAAPRTPIEIYRHAHGTSLHMVRNITHENHQALDTKFDALPLR